MHRSALFLGVTRRRQRLSPRPREYKLQTTDSVRDFPPPIALLKKVLWFCCLGRAVYYKMPQSHIQANTATTFSSCLQSRVGIFMEADHHYY
ncbi:hypothetical protein E2C01_011027 [Portunus trituberculatus]|uniref:Uncharacterized protein n=1 Tax=Portunus trituberculatus TaxID=210409 RepID=A0A5B7DA16_PORTR|nr:hypothetical protein [Portunus trituberculatus]